MLLHDWLIIWRLILVYGLSRGGNYLRTGRTWSLGVITREVSWRLVVFRSRSFILSLIVPPILPKAGLIQPLCQSDGLKPCFLVRHGVRLVQPRSYLCWGDDVVQGLLECRRFVLFTCWRDDVDGVRGKCNAGRCLDLVILLIWFDLCARHLLKRSCESKNNSTWRCRKPRFWYSIVRTNPQ